MLELNWPKRPVLLFSETSCSVIFIMCLSEFCLIIGIAITYLNKYLLTLYTTDVIFCCPLNVKEFCLRDFD